MTGTVLAQALGGLMATGITLWLWWRWRLWQLWLRGARHAGADEGYAGELQRAGGPAVSAERGLAVSEDLATTTELWLSDHFRLDRIEGELRAGLDVAYARLLVGLGLEPDDVDYADAVGLGLTTWDAAREAAGIHTLPPAPQRLALTAGPCADVPELVPA